MTTKGKPKMAEIAGTETTDTATKRRNLLIFTLFLLLLGGVWLLWWIFVGSQRISTNDAYVVGNITPVQAQTTGTIRRVFVQNTERVRAGTVLAAVQGDRARLALQASEAALGRTVRELRREFAAVQEEQQTLAAQRANLQKLLGDLARYRQAEASGAVASIQINNTEQDIGALRAKMGATRAKLQAAQALVGGTTLQNNPQVLAAVAELERRYVDWRRHDIRAPISGFVAQRSAYPGLMIHRGERLFSIVPLDNLWVVANVKETEMARLRPGQTVRLHSYYYGDGVSFHGVVEGLLPGAGSAFATLPPENATGNYIHIVERVPVRISLSTKELEKHPLRPGLSMVADIEIHEPSKHTVLQALTKTPEQGYSTNIYAKELRQGLSLAKRIITRNS